MNERQNRGVKQLDLLRGLAIVLMIVNHAGISFTGAVQPPYSLLSACVFLGSFAPVIFFFTTGFGIGVSRKRVDTWGFLSVLQKAGLLIVADQFLWWKASRPYGLDFLGFIGVSSVLITAIAMVRRPVLLSALSIAAALLLRFGAGSWLQGRYLLTGMGAWIVGFPATADVSYPLSPWIVYPLLGFILGRQYRAELQGFPRRMWVMQTAVAAAALGCSCVLLYRQAVFFRWGTMSFAYFVLSIAVLVVMLASAWRAASYLPTAAKALSLRGVASLAVVPIHYVVLDIAARWVPGAFLPVVWIAIVAVVAASILLANAFTKIANRLVVKPVITAPILGGVILVCAVAMWKLNAANSASALLSFLVGQIAVTGLLAIKNRERRTQAALTPAPS